MYTIHIKRAIILLIACLCLVFTCFTIQISATTTQTPDNTVTAPQTPVEDGTQQDTVSGTDVPGDLSTPTTDSQTESQPESSGLDVETVYVGGAPDATDEMYSGLNSAPAITTTTSTITSYTTTPGNSKPTALVVKISRYAKIGMYSFGVIALLCIFFLVFYNIKIHQNRKALGLIKPKKEKKAKKDKDKAVEKDSENNTDDITDKKDNIKEKSKKKNKIKKSNDKPKHLN